MGVDQSTLDQVLAEVDASLDDSLKRLSDLLAIPSISTDPAYAGDCRRAADWLVNELTQLGFETSTRETEGHPIVVGHARSDSQPNVLFYGHYDVQPVDPLDLWTTDPFTATLLDGPDGEKIIRARGASDDKGQLLTFVEACRAYKKATGSLPVGVSFMLEGEEESGGKNLPPFMEANRAELTSDIALICDSGMWDANTPSINIMLRGMVGEEVVITCAERDLHSGMYGNAARNPIQVLSDIISSLRNEDGSVAVPGFYDDVKELDPEVAKMWNELDFSGEKYLGEVGLKIPAGEKSRSVMEQITSRPTCEINGITGGYTGDGFKTVIPATARAKISFRMVANQDPLKIRDAFRAYVKSQVPEDCEVTFHSHGASPAVAVSTDGPFMLAARAALKDEWGKEPVLEGSGGSIPVAGDFKSILDMDALLIGFALPGDNIHSPNEKYNLKSFHKGIRSWVRVLAGIAH